MSQISNYLKSRFFRLLNALLSLAGIKPVVVAEAGSAETEQVEAPATEFASAEDVEEVKPRRRFGIMSIAFMLIFICLCGPVIGLMFAFPGTVIPVVVVAVVLAPVALIIGMIRRSAMKRRAAAEHLATLNTWLLDEQQRTSAAVKRAQTAEISLERAVQAALRDGFGERQPEVDAANKRASDAEGKLGAANKRASDAEGKLEAANKRASDAEGKLEAANKRASDAEGKLEAAKKPAKPTAEKKTDAKPAAKKTDKKK